MYTPAAADRIEFIDEDDTRSLLLGLFEQVSNARGAVPVGSKISATPPCM